MDFYQTLGVRPDATIDSIEKSFRELSDRPDVKNDVEKQLELHVAWNSIKKIRAESAEKAPEQPYHQEESILDRNLPGVIYHPVSNTVHNHYYHHNYYQQTQTPSSEAHSSLISFVIWFIIAGATTLMVFILAMIGT